VLFDLYRAIGQQHKFESLALDYAQQFGWSAPQWFSMPKLVAEAASEERPTHAHRRPGRLGLPRAHRRRRVAKLRLATLQMPLPWVFDWSALRKHRRRGLRPLSSCSAAGSADAGHALAERRAPVLGAADAAPTGVRDADPAFWQLRLDALRMTNRPDQFDEAAIDYCVTYEVSPPSWEPARCQVRISGSGNTQSSPCRWSAMSRPASRNRRCIDDPAAQVQVARSSCPASWSATSARR
jgi:hypothetical protein